MNNLAADAGDRLSVMPGVTSPDGILILHQGEVVYERYFGCLREDGKHAIMSMTKSITGLLGQILVVEGALDDALLVRDVIPEIGESAFATADPSIF